MRRSKEEFRKALSNYQASSMLRFTLSLLLAIVFTTTVHAQAKLFNDNWQFVKDVDTTVSADIFTKSNSLKWSQVSLPHTANIEPIEKVTQQWQGTCFYRKFFVVPASQKGKHIAIQFDAAMHEADVYLNEKNICKHVGGYLPFYIDISDAVKFAAENVLLIKLNNNDNPVIPPGKPIKDLDFNYYSGIYRNVWLVTKDKLHISNAVAANRKAAGGILTHYENVNENSATLIVQTEVENDFNAPKNAQVRITLSDKTGKTIAQATSKNQDVDKQRFTSFTQSISIANPKLWSPDAPYLYQLSIDVLQDGKVTDNEKVKTGVRTIRFEAGAFYLNDKKINIRGTNRHQEYPYLGNAVSDNAQYRDAFKIKEAGFNFVRSSHYPQSPAFLDACDELGILVMDAIPGWQFVGNETFQQNSYQDIRDMIRRDRNHPSIIMWEASLNESGMKKDYMQKSHAIVHEELPFTNVYSAGWIDDAYDVFLPARQHAKAPDYWKKYKKKKPFLIAEYGDWEYYAQNAGFNQTEYKDLKKEEKTSRQLRGDGEKRMLQQALNYQEAHNDNLYSPAIGDANWLMFDYKRGYASDIESSGIMDIVRLPKFAFYFYQSQVDPVLNSTSSFNNPMLFIANYWDKKTDTIVKVFSNCDAVELLVNGKSVARQQPDKDQYSTNLKHPPFTFHLPAFASGTLTAVGYINNKKAVQQIVRTPAASSKINLRVDYSGKQLKAGQNDAMFVYAEVTDAKGTVVPGATNMIDFKVQGDAEVVGLHTVAAEAGIATILLKAGVKPGAIKIIATSKGLQSKDIIVNSK
jgi:beta-galactosidase